MIQGGSPVVATVNNNITRVPTVTLAMDSLDPLSSDNWDAYTVSGDCDSDGFGNVTITVGGPDVEVECVLCCR